MRKNLETTFLWGNALAICDSIEVFFVCQTEVIMLQYRSASLSINPASRAGECTDCEYIECTIAIIIIVISVRSLFLVY